jgi:hypothetical protein
MPADLARRIELRSRRYECRVLPTELRQSGSESENRTRVGRLPRACSATELSQSDLSQRMSPALNRLQAGRVCVCLKAGMVRARTFKHDASVGLSGRGDRIRAGALMPLGFIGAGDRNRTGVGGIQARCPSQHERHRPVCGSDSECQSHVNIVTPLERGVNRDYFYSRKPRRFPVETVWPFNYGSSAQSAAAGVPVGSILSAYRCALARKRDFRLSSVSPPSSLSAFCRTTASARHISKLKQMRQKIELADKQDERAAYRNCGNLGPRSGRPKHLIYPING